MKGDTRYEGGKEQTDRRRAGTEVRKKVTEGGEKSEDGDGIEAVNRSTLLLESC